MRRGTPEQALDIVPDRSVAAKQEMPSQPPQISGAGHWIGGHRRRVIGIARTA
jgi:hypothetical protein